MDAPDTAASTRPAAQSPTGMAPASHRERTAASHLRHVCGGEIPAPETSHRQTSDDNSPRSRKRQQEHLVGSAPRAALQRARGERWAGARLGAGLSGRRRRARGRARARGEQTCDWGGGGWAAPADWTVGTNPRLLRGLKGVPAFVCACACGQGRKGGASGRRLQSRDEREVEGRDRDGDVTRWVGRRRGELCERAWAER